MRNRIYARVLILMLSLAGWLCRDAVGAVVYVNQAVGGSGDGQTWDTAKKTLEEGLTMADGVTYTEIWVAKGTYVPLATTTFTMKTGVALYGGFDSGDAFSARNWATKVTTLSGDVSGNDQPSFVNRADNRVAVVTFVTTATSSRLDGFVVSGGEGGGGIMISGCNTPGFTVENCWVRDNRGPAASSGGGIYSVYNATGIVGTFKNCIVSGNLAPYDGGGISFDYANSSSFTLINCTVVYNQNSNASRRGGGIYLNARTFTFTMRNCIVYYNTRNGVRQNMYYRGANTVVSGYCYYTIDASGSTTHNIGAGDVRAVDPLLTSSSDFHLTAGSGCKDPTGPITTAPVKDYDLVTRDATPDIGAYEFVAGGDTIPPGEVTGVSVTPGHLFLTLGWTNPGDADFGGVVVIRKLDSAPVGVPSPGVTYTAGSSIGGDPVVYVGSGTGFTDSGLVNSSTYYYKICTYDTPAKNYSTGTGTSGAPVEDTTSPDPVTGLAATALSDTAVQLDWVNSASGDSLGVLIVRKAGGLPTGTPADNTPYTAGATVGDGTVVYVGTGSSGTPGVASTWTDTTLTQELTTYGYSVFAYDVVPNYSTRADDSDTTLTDSTVPGNVTLQTATGDDGAVALAWTHPADLDVAGVVILRSTEGTPDGTLVNGTTYTVGTALGNGTVVYVSGGATPSGTGAWTDQGLANGTAYYYKIFARDEHPNYPSGAACNATPVAPIGVVYVNSAIGSSGDGTTWNTAKKTLTEGLTMANGTTYTEIWVAEGTYKPAAPGGGAASRFDLKTGVKLYGGFTSGMTHRYERDADAHPTVLSGDLNGDDTANWGDRSDNVINVVYASSVNNVGLDGFTVSGGYSVGTAYGAGLYGISCSALTVANCVFTDNRAGYGGGGICLSQSTSVTIERTRFSSNLAIQLGGGMYAVASGTPVSGTVRNCIFESNRCEGSSDSKSDGGGLNLQDAAYNIANCTVYNNYSQRRGGGIKLGQQNVTDVSQSVKNCIFWNNASGTSGAGGALALQSATFNKLVVDMRNCDWPGTSEFYNYQAVYTSGSLLELDPLLVDAANGDFHLRYGSPCLDAGTGSGAPANDYAGTSRPLGAGYEIGAYERVPAAPADLTVNDSPDGGAFAVQVQRVGTWDRSTDFTLTGVDQGSLTMTATSPKTIDATSRYAFEKWNDGTSDYGSNPLNGYNLNGNKTFTLTFKTQYLVATASLPAGSCSGFTLSPADGYVDAGGSIQVTATGILPGFGLSDWLVNGVSQGASDNPHTFNNITGPTTVTAVFACSGSSITVGTSPDGRTYTAAGDGPRSGDKPYCWGATDPKTLATTDNQNDGDTQYRFVNWTDGLGWSDNNLSATYTVPGVDATARANFNTYHKLTVTAPSGGSFGYVPALGDTYYANGQVVTVTATANSTYTFDGWSGTATVGATINGNEITFTMNAPKTLAASFVQVLRVDKDSLAGVGADGSTWALAYPTLQDALAFATAGQQIWVADGTYRPGTSPGDHFNLQTGVAIYGGFGGITGGETLRSERDWNANVTILSGDLGQDDTANWGNRTDNANNVVYAAAGTTGFVLDGFTVRAGDGLSAAANLGNGAGMYMGIGAGGLVANCYFTDNRADTADGYGGAMYPLRVSGMRVENCVFYANRAWRGGAMGVVQQHGAAQSCDFSLVNCTIYGNTISGDRGAGTYNQYIEGWPAWSLKNCIIWGNQMDNNTVINLHFRETNVSGVEYSTYSLSTDGAITYGAYNNNQVDVDPLLTDPNNGNLRLQAGSPCKDTGTSAGAPSFDLDGRTRPYDAGFDMGAYEFGPTYILTYGAGAGGSIVGATPQAVIPGRNGATVTATPNANYHFVSWDDGYPTAARTDLNVAANITATASFAINTYTLTYNVGAGTLTGTSPQTVNWNGSGTSVTANPPTGYHFTQWSDGVLTAARRDRFVVADLTVTAQYAINTYTLTYNVGAGTLTGTSPQTVNYNASGTPVTANPPPGYHFTQWSDGVLTATRTDADVVAAVTVTAQYAANPPLTVTIDQAVGQADPASVSPVIFTVEFSQPVSDFETVAGEVTVGGTAGATAAVISGGPTIYTVEVSGMTGSGTVTASIDAGRAHDDAYGTANDASTSTDNTVTYNAAVPLPDTTLFKFE